MKVAILGSGGREHSILKKIQYHPKISQLFAIPGNAGMNDIAQCVALDINNKEDILTFAKEQKLDFVIVSPDNPLVLGMVDFLEDHGIQCFGPRANAAILEGSKIFAKNFMKKHSIPTAHYWVFDCLNEALAFLQTASFPLVIKADGLALGKGVIIAKDRAMGEETLQAMMRDEMFGESGKKVVIEEFLEGKEATILAFCDGKTLIPMISSMDYKKALDHDFGANTGGMGCIAPNPYYTDEIHQECLKTIFLPTLKALQEEKREFKGCLYFGLMLTKEGAKVIEYNCRFGDPEAQTILPLLQSNLFEIMLHIANGTLNTLHIEFQPLASCCVVLASKGYPQSFQTGYPLTYPQDLDICFAGVKEEKGKLVNSGGRVLSITSTAPTPELARNLTYEKIKQISLENGYFRKDIGELE